MKCSIIVPSISRHNDLRRCLQGISRQTVKPFEILVVTQEWDTETMVVAHEFGADVLVVPGSGVARAIEHGIRNCQGDIACFTDDDAIPRPDWMERIRSHFESDPKVGVISGRDVLSSPKDLTILRNDLVGVIRFGKIYGNHHIGGGSVRVIDHAKGANMAVRTEAAKRVPLASLVRGNGAQIGNELIMSLGITSFGFKCLFDPKILVDHYPAKRLDGDARELLSYNKTKVRSYNRAYAMARFARTLPSTMYFFRSIILGDRFSPGIVLAIFLEIRDIRTISPRFIASVVGLLQAYLSATIDRRTNTGC